MNSNGYTTICFVILLPLIMTLLFLFLGLLKLYLVISETNYFCRTTAIDFQNQQKKYLTKIISYNPKAKRLRKLRRAAEKKLKKALILGRPTLIAYYKAKLLSIILKQKDLKSRQVAQVRLSKQAISYFTKRISNYFAKGKNRRLISVSFNQALAVNPLPINSLTPSYYTSMNFKNDQAVHVHWKIKFKTLLNSFFQKLPLPQNFTFSGRCGATITKENLKWIVVLHQDKL